MKGWINIGEKSDIDLLIDVDMLQVKIFYNC